MIHLLERLGFALRRQKGSDATFCHADGRRATVPIHPGDLPRSIFLRILKGINVSEEDIRELL
jgi:predicted RNA binding protein YcfA (HicA-like mRNA interferase family)